MIHGSNLSNQAARVQVDVAVQKMDRKILAEENSNHADLIGRCFIALFILLFLIAAPLLQMLVHART